MLETLRSSVAGIRDQLVAGWFATGFLGPRTDLGWPSGVQEDDDHHWTWSDPTTPARGDEVADPLAVARVEHPVIRRPGR
jgi:hypothetical protein